MHKFLSDMHSIQKRCMYVRNFFYIYCVSFCIVVLLCFLISLSVLCVYCSLLFLFVVFLCFNSLRTNFFSSSPPSLPPTHFPPASAFLTSPTHFYSLYPCTLLPSHLILSPLLSSLSSPLPVYHFSPIIFSPRLSFFSLRFSLPFVTRSPPSHSPSSLPLLFPSFISLPVLSCHLFFSILPLTDWRECLLHFYIPSAFLHSPLPFSQIINHYYMK